MGKLDSKTAIITGGAGGIGFETARLFIREGAYVFIADTDVEKGKQAQESLGTQCKFIKTDVTDKSSAYWCMNAAARKSGKIDILVNNAGITADASLLNMTEEQFDSVINVNLKGIFNMSKYVAGVMATNNYGRIINISSIVGIYGNYGQTNYAASKSGVIGMTKVWARELGKKGITVNAVAPGFISTDMISKVPEKVLRSLIERTPAGRLGKPEDIANACLFLASEEASFVNGIVLSVDGGLTL
jgi:3-oxoacyl-[acyl-carrier protein] reductase